MKFPCKYLYIRSGPWNPFLDDTVQFVHLRCALLNPTVGQMTHISDHIYCLKRNSKETWLNADIYTTDITRLLNSLQISWFHHKYSNEVIRCCFPACMQKCQWTFCKVHRRLYQWGNSTTTPFEEKIFKSISLIFYSLFQTSCFKWGWFEMLNTFSFNKWVCLQLFCK